jgi:ubiquinone/menaquinone biosynthesis C-methylase UbiE
MIMTTNQNKSAEIRFFDRHAEDNRQYNVFTDASNNKIVDMLVQLGRFQQGEKVLDTACGTGVFTELLRERHGLKMQGTDISSVSMDIAQEAFPQVPFFVSDAENMPVADNSYDGITLIGVVHHFPDPREIAAETYRMTRPGGRFVTFDPNRRNPFHYLYRDRTSPFYSPLGVTENERPVLSESVKETFEHAGFKNVTVHYLSGLHYRYVKSPVMRTALPIYNTLDSVMFSTPITNTYSSFVMVTGEK